MADGAGIGVDRAQDFHAIAFCAHVVAGIRKVGRPVTPDNQTRPAVALDRLLADGLVPLGVEVDERILAIDVDKPNDPAVRSFAADLIDEGLAPIVLASGRPGGRHIWTLIPDLALKARFERSARRRNWDVRKGGTVIRPPGIPHRTGAPVSILYGAGSWQEVADQLTPSTVEVPTADEIHVQYLVRLRAARAARAAEAHVAEAKQAPGPAPAPKSKVLSEHISRLIERGNHADHYCYRTGTGVHTRSCAGGHHHGRVTNSRCYDSTSEAVQAVFTAAVQLGWHFDRTLGHIQAHGANGLWVQIEGSKANHSTDDGEAWLERSWAKAVEFVRRSPATDRANPETLARLFTAAIINTPFESAITRAVLYGYLTIAYRRGGLAGFSAAGNEVADRAGVARNTVAAHTRKLIDLGWLRQDWATTSLELASRWSITMPSEVDFAAVNAWSGEHRSPDPCPVGVLDPGEDLWRHGGGLGKTAWEMLWLSHHHDRELTFADYARLSGRNISTIYRVAERLARTGIGATQPTLLTDGGRRNHAWTSSTSRLDAADSASLAMRIADKLGTLGTRERRRAQAAAARLARDAWVLRRRLELAELRTAAENGDVDALEQLFVACGPRVRRRYGERLCDAVRRARSLDLISQINFGT